MIRPSVCHYCDPDESRSYTSLCSQFFSEEIAVPMGLNMHIGLQTAESEKMQVARLYQLPYDIPESADHHDATQAQVFDQLSLNPSISKPHSSPDKMEVARYILGSQHHQKQ